MIVGLSFTLFYIAGTKAHLIFGAEEAWFGNWCFGISAEGIGTVGMLLNFAVALVVSRLTPPPPQEVMDILDELRMPDHVGPAVILDESTE